MAEGRRFAVLGPIDRLFRTGTASGFSDGQLLDRFAHRHGEAAEAAFEALVERHGPMVLGVCRRVLNDPHDAQDAFQATFLVLVRKAGSVRKRGSLGSWLFGVALRVSAHARAASARRRRAERSAGQRGPLTHEPAVPDREVWEEVGLLPEDLRAAVVLCYLEGLTHEQAAQRLGWPVGTVRSRLFRARDRLRTRLRRRGLDPESALVLPPMLKAALPQSLLDQTVKGAFPFASCGAAGAGLVPAAVAALTEGVLHSMFVTKLKWAAAALVTAGTFIAGAGVYGQKPPGDASKPPAQDAPTSPKAEDGAEQEKDRLMAGRSVVIKIEAYVQEARRLQEKGDLTGALLDVMEVQKLARTWADILTEPSAGDIPRKKSWDTLYVRKDWIKAREAVMAGAVPPPTANTDRRIEELERKFDRLLRTLEGASTEAAGKKYTTIKPAPDQMIGGKASAQKKLRQARALIGYGRYDDAARIAREVLAWGLSYDTNEDTPAKVFGAVGGRQNPEPSVVDPLER